MKIEVEIFKGVLPTKNDGGSSGNVLYLCSGEWELCPWSDVNTDDTWMRQPDLPQNKSLEASIERIEAWFNQEEPYGSDPGTDEEVAAAKEDVERIIDAARKWRKTVLSYSIPNASAWERGEQWTHIRP